MGHTCLFFDELKGSERMNLESLTDKQLHEMERLLTELTHLMKQAKLTEDPLQVMFGGRVAHGILSAGFISAVIGMRLPGPGSIYLSQSLRFTKPVRIGDTVTARVEVLEVIATKRRVRLATTCRNQNGEVVVDGEAVVMLEPGA